MKLRLPGRRDRTEAAPDPAADLTAQLVRTSGKGRPTPKRNEAQGRRPGPPPPPPQTRKEAYKRMREQQAATRGASRAGAARGDDSYLPARDRGPVRLREPPHREQPACQITAASANRTTAVVEALSCISSAWELRPAASITR